MVRIEKLTYRYSRSKSLFNGLDLELPPGKIYGLLGKNGAGKSSLMKNMAGLLMPTEGVCRVNGFEAARRQTSFLQQLFFIPEECYLPALTIPQWVSLYAPFYPRFSHEDFRAYLHEFGLEEGAHLQQLSFGQKKKALISFGLAARTALLIMDEPTNGLDIPSKVQFRNIVAKMDRADRITLLSTHQVKDLDSLVHALVLLDAGEVLLYDDCDRLGRKFRFGTGDQLPADVRVLYSEPVHNGYAYMIPNEEKTPSRLDLELLFNAALYDKTLFTKSLYTPATCI